MTAEHIIDRYWSRFFIDLQHANFFKLVSGLTMRPSSMDHFNHEAERARQGEWPSG